MPQFTRSRLFFASILFPTFLFSCRNSNLQPQSDSPRLSPRIALKDITLHSASLGRDIQYRVILPNPLPPGKKFPALYLLHGGGGNFRDWSNYSDVDTFAERDLILVMPEGHSSYYTNSATRPEDRYGDYITKDLIADVEQRFPVIPDRSHRAIAGVSMGGFGAIKLALVHPDLFSFAAGLSPALDVPSRPFSLKRIDQWRRFRAIFGPWQGEAQRNNDPLLLVKTADPGKTPYIFLTCGEEEGLLTANNQFAAQLKQRGFKFEYHTGRGNHDWAQWNSWLPSSSTSLLQHFPAKE